MPIPFLNSINLTKNQVENFCIYNVANDPTGSLTAAGDYGYFWLNTTSSGGVIPTLKWWDGANVRSLIDSTNIGSFTSGLATDLAGGGAGQIVYQDGANDTKFLAAGTTGQVLSSNGASAPSWLNQSSLSAGTAANISGGLAGQLLYQSALATTAKLTIGTAGQALVVNAGATAPEWVDQSTFSVGSATNKPGGNVGDILVQSGSGTTGFLNVGTTGQVITSNGASPQYVNQSTLSVGSATTSGTATNIAGGAANRIPYQTAAGTTAFITDAANAILTTNASSVPALTAATNVTVGKAVDIALGAAGDLLYQSASNDTSFLNIGANGSILTSTGTAPQWSASIPSGSVSGLAASATTDTTDAGNISSGTLGLARLALATGQFYVGDASNNPAATLKSSIPLSGFGAAGADVAMGGFKITGLDDPEAGTDAANKDYVDSVAQGLDVKASCKVGTIANITLSGPGASIDGISLSVDDRVLVKNQTDKKENGIYLWKGAALAMVRSADADTVAKLTSAFTFVEQGTNADSGWVCTVNSGTIGSVDIEWEKFSQAGSYTQGRGMVLDGTAFNFAQSTNYTADTIPYASGATTIGFIGAGNADQVLRVPGAGGTPAFGAIDLSKSAAVTGTLAVGNGGTGITSFGAGIAAFLGTPTSANLATAVTDETGTGALVFANSPTLAGTPLSTTATADTNTTQIATTAYVIGQASATTPAALGTAAVGTSLKYARADHVHALPTIDLSNGVTGTLPVANGGTGASTFTAGRILFGNGTNAIATSSSLNWDSSNNRLGIGTGTPGYEVDVVAPAGVGVQIFENSTTTNKRLRITQQTDHASYDATFTSGGNAHKWKTGSTERFAIDGNGIATWSNVGGVAGTAMTLNGTGLGVGETSTGSKLHVKGTGVNIAALVDSSATGYSGLVLKGTGSQNFSIGMGGPSETAFSVANKFFLYDGLAGAMRLVVDSSGNVGIGTATPNQKFVSAGPRSYFAGDGALYAIGVGSTTARTATNEVYYIGATNSATPDLVFTNAYAVEGMRITHSGNVGIGTATPNRKLEVAAGTSGAALRLTNTNGGSGIEILTASNKKSWLIGAQNNVDEALEITPSTAAGGTTFSTPAVVVTASGNVGIGTTSPQAKLSVETSGVQNTISPVITAQSTGTTYAGMYSVRDGAGDQRGLVWQVYTVNVGLGEKMRLDSSGNLGLGVTPSAWKANHKAIQFGPYSGSYGTLYVDDSGNSWFGELFYQGASNRIYTGTGNAAAYRLTATGQHQWYTDSVGGVSGGTVTLTQAMTLDASGNLALGTSTANFRADIQNASGAAVLRLKGGTGAAQGSAVYMTYAGGANTLLGIGDRATILGGTPDQLACIYSGVALTFEISGAERLRLKTTGQVNFVGLASDPAGAAGDVVYNSTSNRLKYHNGTAWVNTGTNKYSGALTGTGTSFTVTHNLGTRDVTVAVRKSGSTYDQVFTDVQMTTDNTVTIVFASSVTGSDYTVTVIG